MKIPGVGMFVTSLSAVRPSLSVPILPSRASNNNIIDMSIRTMIYLAASGYLNTDI